MRNSGSLDAIITEISKSGEMYIEAVHERKCLTSVVYAYSGYKPSDLIRMESTMLWSYQL